MIVRPATTDDVAGVLALWSAARSSAAVTPDTAESVAGLIARDPEGLLIADDAGVVGAIIAGWDGWGPTSTAWPCCPSAGERASAVRWPTRRTPRCAPRGAPRATALVATDEAEATGFWRALGYDHDPQMARFVRNL